MFEGLYRSVVYETKTDEQIAEIGKEIDRFDEDVQAIEWILARTPDKVGYPIPRQKNMRIIKTSEKVRFLYQYDDEEVVILSINCPDL